MNGDEISDIHFARGDIADESSLKLHERLVLYGFFDEGRTEISIKSHENVFAATLGSFVFALQKVIERKGYYNSKNYTILILFIVSFMLGLVAPPLLFILFPPLVMYLLLIGQRPSYTAKVKSIWPQLLGFKKYILMTAKERSLFHAAVDNQLDVIERDFAYAVALRADKAWEKAVHKLAITHAKANGLRTAAKSVEFVSLSRKLTAFVTDNDPNRKQ